MPGSRPFYPGHAINDLEPHSFKGGTHTPDRGVDRDVTGSEIEPSIDGLGSTRQTPQRGTSRQTTRSALRRTWPFVVGYYFVTSVNIVAPFRRGGSALQTRRWPQQLAGGL